MKAPHSVYFDNNSTHPVYPEVIAAMADVQKMPLNPSSVHAYGREGKRILEQARFQLASLVGADKHYQLLFTSGGTESNNLALRGMLGHAIVCAATEHVSVLNIASGALLKVSSEGVIDLEHLAMLLATLEQQQAKVILSVSIANNETGVIQPLSEILRLARKHQAILHVDACQYVGRKPFSMQDLDVDMLTVSAHKFGGPQGVGALVFNKNLPLQAISIGGGQEHRFRPGTHNLAAIHGLGVAAEIAPSRFADFAGLRHLRDHIEESICAIAPGAQVFGQQAERLENTLNIAMPGVKSETQLIFFDSRGFSLSAGSACSSGRSDLPHVQMAMGFDESLARAAIRISLGYQNTKAEAEAFIEAWKNLYYNTKEMVQR